MTTESGKRARAQWERDLEAWAVANEARLRAAFNPNQTVADAAKPKADVSDIIRVAREARQRPEIWDQFVALRERERLDPKAILDNDEIALCGRFSNWYRIRNGLDDLRQAYAFVPGLLRKFALGEIAENDDAAAKRWLMQFPFVRDDEQEP